MTARINYEDEKRRRPTQKKERKPTRKHGAEENMKKHVPPGLFLKLSFSTRPNHAHLSAAFGGAPGYQKLLPCTKTGDAV